MIFLYGNEMADPVTKTLKRKELKRLDKNVEKFETKDEFRK